MKTAFLFSGQGSQYPGMMKDLADKNQVSIAVFQIADESLGRSISELCFNGTKEELSLTQNTQPCVLAADLAAYEALSAYHIYPDAVAGFSLGEYGALAAAGVISYEDVFPLIQKRADFMQEAVPVGTGAMAAVMKLDEEEVKSLCQEIEGYVEPANYNCPGQIVVSGEFHAVEQLVEIAKRRKIRAMMLPVSAPFHCRLMNSATEKLNEYLKRINFSQPSVPIYMNVDGYPAIDTDDILKKLTLQSNHPIRWEDTLRNIHYDGVDTFIELGPGKTLAGFVRKTFSDEDVKIYNVSDQGSLECTIATLKGEI